ncbi:MAG: protease modulator HflK [Myxococcota bacterium]
MATVAMATLQLVVAQLTGRHSLTVAGLWLVLVALVLSDVRARQHQRAYGSGEAGRYQQRILPSLVAGWCILAFALFIGYDTPSDPEVGVGSAAIAAGVGLGFATLLVRYYAGTDTTVLPEAPFLAAWFRSTLWVFSASGAALLIEGVGWMDGDRVAVRVLVIACLVPGLEWILRSLHRGQPTGLVGGVGLISLHFQKTNPLGSLFDQLERTFGVDLRSTWALKSARRATHPLLIVLCCIAWGSSAFVSVRAHETGILERMGSPIGSLAPGLHLKAPWPIDRVQRVPAGRIEIMPLGYAGQIEGSSQLWAKQHAQEEHNLLLGDGRELIAVNALLQYQINDPEAWHYGTQNPRHALRGIAEQSLLQNTVGHALDDVLSERTTDFSRRVERDIANAADELGLGVSIVGLSLQSLHPPLQVATDYQAVVSAQHEQEARVLSAAAYRTKAEQVAQSTALEIESEAKQGGTLRLAMARGEAAGFTALSDAHRAEPSLFRFRRRLESLERGLSGRNLNLIDTRIEQDGGSLWFSE